jgi:hypothetical protein
MRNAHVGQDPPQELDASLALRAPAVVLGRRELVLDAGVADEDDRARHGKRNRLGLERPAVDEQRVVGLAEGRDELIHDSAHGADISMFGGLTRERELDAREFLVARKRRHGQSERYLERGR